MKKLVYLLTVVLLSFLLCSDTASAQGISGSGFGDDAPQVTSEPNSLLQESQQGLWLIKATCLSISQDAALLAVWRIDYVFNGPKEMVSKQFKASHQRGNFGGSSLSFVPDVNEKALWVVQFQNQEIIRSPSNSVESQGARREAYNARFPIAQNHPTPKGVPIPSFADFAQALAYAQSIERVAKADRNEQIRLLGAYAKSALPQRSAWAISTLAQSGVERAPLFLLGLVSNAKIPIQGQLSLDQGLNLLDEAGKMQWSYTSTRFGLWRRLVTAPANEFEAISIVSDIVDLGQKEVQGRRVAQANKATYRPAIGGARLFEWLRLAAANSKWAPRSRSFALSSIGNMTHQSVIARAAAWPYLLGQVRSYSELAAIDPKKSTASSPLTQASVVGGALTGISWLSPFSPAETAALQALQKSAKSPELKRSLEELIKEKR